MLRRIYVVFLLFVLLLLVFSACSNTKAEETTGLIEDEVIQIQYEEIAEEIEEVEEPEEEIVVTQYEVVEYSQEIEEVEEVEIFYDDITFTTIDGGLVYLADGVEVTIISPPRYISVGAFQEGFARVSTEWAWGNIFLTDPRASYPAQGFIDETGREVIPLIFENVQNFSEGLAGAQYEGLWGFIAPSGEWVIPPTFSGVSPFNNGQAIVAENLLSVGVIDRTGQVVIPFHLQRGMGFFEDNSELMRVNFGGSRTTGIIDREGNEVVAPRFFRIRPVTNELFIGELANHDRFGVIDASGNEIIPFVYSFIRGVPEYERFLVRTGRWPAIRWGLFDFNGREILPPVFQQISVFSEGLSAAKKDDYWGYINPDGEIVIPFIYSNASHFIHGVAVVEKNGEVGVIDRDGTIIVPFGRYRMLYHTGYEVMLAGAITYRWNDYWGDFIWGFINIAGEELIPPTFEFSRWFWWDNIPIDFAVLDSMFYYGNGMVAVLDWDAGWGFVDTNGQIAVEPRFGHATAFHGNYAVVGNNMKHLIWGSSGEVIVGGIWHLINRQGDILASFEYAHVELISDNLLIFAEDVSYHDYGDVGSFGGYGRVGIIHFSVD